MAQDTNPTGGESAADVEALQAEVERLRAENAQLTQHDTAVLETGAATTAVATGAGGHRRWRWTGAIALLVVAALLTPPALVGFWGRRTITDAERYLATVAPLASSPAIQEAVATEVSTQLLAAARSNVDGVLAQLDLPPAVIALRPAIAGAVDSFVESSVRKFMASEQFDALWLDVNEKVQVQLVAALNGDTTGAVQIRDGAVYLDLSIVVEAVRQALVSRGLTILTNVQVPDQLGREIVLITSPQLDAAQNVWRYTEPIARWMLPIVFLLYLAAVLLAPNRRRMLLLAGVVVVAGMALLAVALNVVRGEYVDAVADGTIGAALTVFYDTMIRYLWTALGALFTLGLVVVVLAWLGGPSAPASAIRRAESRATGAAGRAVGRWQPMQTLGEAVRRGRTILRIVLLATVIVAFIAGGRASWELVLVAVGLSIVLWLVVDVLAAAAPDGEAAEAGPAPPVAVGA